MTSHDSGEFGKKLAGAATLVEIALREILDGLTQGEEPQSPPRLAAAMRHAVLAGGKRFRPFLLMECAALFGIAPAHSVERRRGRRMPALLFARA